MFFRNALIYRVTGMLDLTNIETQLAERKARPCADTEAHTIGFVAPIGKQEDAPLAYISGGHILIHLQREERILPGFVVREAVAEKVEEIESRDARKVYKRERDSIKDDIIISLLPRAFVRKTVTRALLMPAQGLVIVDGSVNRAEDLLSILRECLGSLPVRPLNVKISPTAVMTDWLKRNEATNGIVIGDECELRDTSDDGGIVRCKHLDLASDEVQQHLESGKQVWSVSVQWQEKLRFVLTGAFDIKRIAFTDLISDAVNDQVGEDEDLATHYDATLLIMASTFADLVESLSDAFGGEDIPQGI